MPQFLFVYGTLIEPRVQRAVIGRMVKGTPDGLQGFKKSELRQGRVVYPIIYADESSRVDGWVLQVSAAELEKMDVYEGAEYKRARVVLESGKKAWVYLAR